MSNDVVFVPEAMYEMAADLEVWADDLRDTGDDVDEALDDFRSSSSEFVPALPAHGAAIDSAADLTVVLAENVALLGAAAEEADRQGIRDFTAVVTSVAAGIRTADLATNVPAGILRLVRTSIHGTRAVDAGARTWNLARQYGNRPMPDIGRIRARTPGGATMARSEVRVIQRAKYRELKVARRLLLRRSASSGAALRTNQALTGAGRRVQDFLRNTRPGRVLTVGGRALGVAGAGLSFYNSYTAVREGDTEGAITSGLAGAGSVMMLTPNPVIAGIGAAIVVGVVVYEKWDTISGWADSAADAIGDGVSSVVGGAGRFLVSIF